MMEILSIIAAAFELLGLFLLGKKNRIGFISNIVAGSLWITYTLISKNAIGLLFVCSIALFLNLKGFRNWKK